MPLTAGVADCAAVVPTGTKPPACLARVPQFMAVVGALSR